MQLRKKLVTAAVGAAATATLLVGAASPAGAAGNSWYRATNPNGCADVDFGSYGEHFLLHDDCADGYGVAVVYWEMVFPGDDNLSKRASLEIKYLHSGNGYTVDIDESFPEGETIKFYACTSSGSTLKSCGSVRVATA